VKKNGAEAFEDACAANELRVADYRFVRCHLERIRRRR
jgi:hypothetical protein